MPRSDETHALLPAKVPLMATVQGPAVTGRQEEAHSEGSYPGNLPSPLALGNGRVSGSQEAA